VQAQLVVQDDLDNMVWTILRVMSMIKRHYGV
jgi:hypothetical protein